MGNNLPEKQQRPIFQGISYCLSLGQMFYKMQQTYSSCCKFIETQDYLNNAYKLLNQITDDSKATVKELSDLKNRACWVDWNKILYVSFQFKNNLTILTKRIYSCRCLDGNKDSETMIKEIEMKRETILNEIKDYQRQIAVETVSNSIICGSIIRTFQLLKISLAWSAMQSSETAVQISETHRKEIGTALTSLEAEFGEFIEYQQKNPTDEQKNLAKLTCIIANMTKLIDDIGNLRVNLNGKIELLKTWASTQFMDGISNSITFATQLSTTATTWSALHNITNKFGGVLRWTSAGLTALFGLVSVTNFALSYKTNQQIRKLRNELANVDTLNRQLTILINNAVAAT